MSVQKILQPLDVNSASMDRSPARKRARYESPVKERWSLTNNSVQLDEVFDYGLGVLDSDSDTQTDEEIQKETRTQYDNYDLSQTPEKQYENKDSIENTTNIPLDEWEGFLIKKAEVTSSHSINYFSSLSDEVILHILHFLPKRQLLQVAPVCRRFHRLSTDESLWARMDVSCRMLYPGALGLIISRQVAILRLAQSEIADPVILPDCRASYDDFQARLFYLDLSMVHISTPSLVALFSKCRRLKKLSLEHVTVNNAVLEALSRNTELEVLNLAMAVGLEVNGLKHILNNCKKLRELNLAWTSLNDAAVKYVCAHLPKTLDRLNISGCRKLLLDDNVLDIVKSCRGLRELDLSDCTGLTGQAIQHIIDLDALNFLALSRCYLVPYKSILLLKKIESLVYLDIHGGYIDYAELKIIQEGLGVNVELNKFKFSSVARPTVGGKRSSIWNMRVRD